MLTRGSSLHEEKVTHEDMVGGGDDCGGRRAVRLRGDHHDELGIATCGRPSDRNDAHRNETHRNDAHRDYTTAGSNLKKKANLKAAENERDQGPYRTLKMDSSAQATAASPTSPMAAAL
jgi:hypothetical protein